MPEGPSRGDIPNEIIGTSGWRADLIDNDESPARHFVGWLATGYFHPRVADEGLAIQESPGIVGASLQDIRSGEIAISVGVALRRGNLSRREAIWVIWRDAGDPSYAGGMNEPEPTDTSKMCYIPLVPC
jgi:hypothetical protein